MKTKGNHETMKIWQCTHVDNIDCVEPKVYVELFTSEKDAEAWVAEQLRLDRLNWPWTDSDDEGGPDTIKSADSLNYSSFDISNLVYCKTKVKDLQFCCA